jgi:hypothetical protein
MNASSSGRPLPATSKIEKQVTLAVWNLILLLRQFIIVLHYAFKCAPLARNV